MTKESRKTTLDQWVLSSPKHNPDPSRTDYAPFPLSTHSTTVLAVKGSLRRAKPARP
jgi:hypothetical protein